MIDGAGTNHFVTLMICLNYSCILKIGMSHTKVHISPPGRGRVLPYILYRYMYEPLWTLWFISSLLWNRVYKSESLGPRIGYHFQDTDQLFKDFRLDTNFQLKIALCQFVDKNDYWENHRFKLEHDEVLKGWFLNEWVRI